MTELRPVIADADGATRAVELLCATFGVAADEVRVVRSPYRICPLGAHVDHQFGAVAASAIEHAVYLAYLPVDDGSVRLVSDEFPGIARIECRSGQQPEAGAWDNYARGAVEVLCRRGVPLRGMLGASVGGRSRAGLSSSAAVGVAYLTALADCADVSLQPEDLIRCDEAIEKGFLKLKNGILDPAAVVFARRGALAEIDTRTCTARLHDAPRPFHFIAFHSGIAETLTPANFNERVEQSLRAAAALSELAGLGLEAPRLGDVPQAVYETHAAGLAPVEQRRARHFFEETARVRGGVAAWRDGDAAALGVLMRDSARSSIENYECGATPVRDLVGFLNDHPGVYGARFSGPGFRGCCVALIDDAAVDEVVADVHRAYARKHPALAQHSWVLDCGSADGTSRLL